jgi:hypothetical protein
MDPKQQRLQALREFLSQAGKRLSAATLKSLEETIAKLTDLIGAEETDEEAVEQSYVSAQMLLVQEMVTGISVATTYEMLIAKVDRALSRDKELPGNYRCSIYTDPSWVAFYANAYDWDSGKTFMVDYEDGEDGIVFSNLRDCSLETIIRVIDESADGYAVDLQRKELMQSASQQSELPAVHMLEGPQGPLLLQTMPGSVRFQKKGDRYVIQGIATHGNVPNRNNPPIVFQTACWDSELASMQELISQGKAIGCLGHPTTQDGGYREPEPDEYVVRFTSLSKDGDLFPFEAVTTTNSKGKELVAMMDDGINFDMSTVSFGKVKKQDWNGQEMNVVQVEDFTWIRIADVVLQGASPGAEITDVRLQALGMGPLEEETKMTPEEVQKLLQELRDKHDAETANLQAELKKITDSLEQSKSLTAEQEDMLKQATEVLARDKAAEVIKARDAKIVEVVDDLTQGETKKFEPMFAKTAISLLQGMTGTADDVDAKLPALMEAMKPLLVDTAILQTKGILIPEYKQDGSKIVVNTPEEAIEDLVQTAIKQGKITDTGVDEPSNMARNARIMLQATALDKPAYAVAHMRMKNGDCRDVADMKSFLQQNYRMLTQDIPTGAMTTDDVAAAIPYVLPIVMEMIPQLIAARYCSLQPMSRSKGTIAYWKVYGQDAQNADMLIKDVDNFTGSYANDPGEKQEVKKLKGKITTENIEPMAKKLGYDLSVEVIRRLRTDWGMDASSVMVAECAAEIAREWNFNHLAAIVQGATGGNRNYGTVCDTSGMFDARQWQEQLMTYITFSEADIGDLTQANTVAILGSRSSMARIGILAKQVGLLRENGVGVGSIARGFNIVGALATGEELVSVDWWDNIVAANKLLLIARGSEWYRSGFIVAPYLGLYVTPQWIDPGTLDVEQGMLSEVAEKMVDGNYFGTITIQEGTTGVPI